MPASPGRATLAAPVDHAHSRNPFASAGFPRYWAALMIAGTGLGIQTVTVPLLLRDRVALDERAAAISAALIVQHLPGALLALVGGALADRVERSRVLVTTYSLVASVSLVYVLLALDPAGSIWPVFPLVAVVGAAAAFTNPARQSVIPQLVTSVQLRNGVIFANTGNMGAMLFLGPSVAGLAVDGIGLPASFGLQALLLALAAGLFVALRTPVPERSGAGTGADLMAGLRYVRGRPGLLPLLLLGGVVSIFFIGPFSVTIPILVPDVYAAPDKWVGIFWGCFGGGFFAGSLLLVWKPLPRRGLWVMLSNLLGGLSLCAFALSRDLALSCGILALWGVTAATFSNYVLSLLQEHTEPPMLGRVMSMYTLCFFAANPIGYAQSGWLAGRIGVEATLLASGLAAAGIGLVSLVGLRSVRRLD